MIDAQLRKIVVESSGGVLIYLKVVPGSSRTKIAGVLGDRLKVSVSAPAEGGKANKMVCELLAGVLGVGRKDVVVQTGKTQPRKGVFVGGVEVDCVVGLLKELLAK